MQDGRDKRFLIQKLCQAQRIPEVRPSQPRQQVLSSSSSRRSPNYETSFSNNFDESLFLVHSPPDSSTHV